jgi:hypothetical protein
MISSIVNRFRILVPKKNKIKPEFLIIGAQKSGTTSLFKYLSKHPSLISSKEKEVGFFYDDAKFTNGKEWYLKTAFPPLKTDIQDKLFYESTPEYIYYPVCASRIYSYNKKMKFILILRDPVDRAFSSWNMFRNFQNDARFRSLTEYRDFDKCIMSEMDLLKRSSSFDKSLEIALERSYLRRGMYYFQIMRFLKYFSRDQLYITETEFLKTQPANVLREIADFLNIPHFQWDKIKFDFENEGKYGSTRMSDEIQNFLSSFFQPHNLKLFELIKKEFQWR